MRLVRDIGIWMHISVSIDMQQKSNEMCRIIIREQKYSKTHNINLDVTE